MLLSQNTQALTTSGEMPVLPCTPSPQDLRYYIVMQATCLITAMLLLLSASATAPTLAASSDNSTHMTAAELNTLLQSGHAPVIVDVRSGREYRAGHVPGAIHLPFWLAFARADEIDAPKDEPVVVYCAHGPRAGLGKAALLLEGFTQVRYLQGHMSGWYRAGLPVETAAE